MWASSAASSSGGSSHAPARRLEPVSVITSSVPDSNATTSRAVFVCFWAITSFPADMRCTISVFPSSAVKSRRFARRPTAEKCCPTSDLSGGSMVFTVAK